MKIIISLMAALLLVTVFPSTAAVIAGPIINRANGHEYYLLSPDTWSASEAEAENLGGTLAIIKNAAEQEWVFSKFGSYDGVNRNLWIGFHRQWNGVPNAPFAWVTDQPVDYANWFPGEPNNAGGNETAAEMFAPGNPWGHPAGTWNDSTDDGASGAGPQPCGVVEVPGKSQEESLADREKSLVGTWYNNGDPNQCCWIASTGQLLFAIDQNQNNSRIIFTPEGFLFSSKWKQHVQIIPGKLLWSRGNWWSRTPFKYTAAAKSEPADN